MTPAPFARLVADDLSGAAEAAGVVHRHGHAAAVVLTGRAEDGVVAIEDLDVRNAGAEAAARISRAMGAGPRPDYVKIDSQLRGPVAELIAAAARGAAVVLAPALPALARTVSDGVPLMHGVPLSVAEGSAWRTEASAAPRRLSDLVPAGLEVRPASLDDVRSGAFADRLARDPAEGVVHLPDAVDTADLHAIARALCAASGPVTPVGSAGLLDALLTVSPRRPAAPAAASTARAERVVLVLGSLEPAVGRQRAALRRSAETVVADAADDPADLAARIAAALDGPSRVVVVATVPVDGAHDVGVASRIGAAVAAAVRARPTAALALIGGETARRTLQSLDERALVVAGEVHPGAVLGIASGGRPVVTRPGSFGDDDSLDRIITTLLGDIPRGDHQEEGPQ
ncbi:four-carbon acid sugar kinase family protein [Microbacterium marinilacus]|uniref:4-hydroxythreonine-4-phosphate dehydrogenase n=1 Tax=Microbacterium marinilacus TaxID=415209 RepID=A0ABP7BW93_9MICO|nr:four-carbon acid sugar kinase family protein [Microbacterium marinilacus]MBY0688115.1 four-carbon acid sugar kinase family protein [Microbacterium marinilacus]